MGAKEEMEKKRDEYRKMWPSYDKWGLYKYRWWSKDDIPHIPDFSGTGKDWKWPTLVPTGKTTIPPMDKDDRVKIVNNSWRNCVMVYWHVLHEELGKEKAADLTGYMWVAMAAAMPALEGRYWAGQPRDCVMISKQFQLDCLYEMHDFHVVEESPEKAVIQLHCTYYGDWLHRWKVKGIEIEHGLCDLGCMAFCEEWAQRVNPNIRSTRTKYEVHGDPCCEYTFELT